jgi:hypothetical protein
MRSRPAAAFYLSFMCHVESFLIMLRPMGKDTAMSTTDVPADFVDQPAAELVEAQPASSKWAETALTVLFTVTAVLFVSFVAVVAGLV